MKKRISESNIQTLKENEVFVFGSNLSGFHGGGAARLAHEKFGAVWGVGIGSQGQSYAIPTKSEGIKRTLTLDEIKPYTDGFIFFASRFKRFDFLVTEVGCGLAGLSIEDIAPMFFDCIHLENVFLPARFWEYYEKEKLC